MMIRPLSGASVPARICISVDLPAPLWPTSPTHSPTSAAKSTPASARTAPKCFSTPSSLTIFTDVPEITRDNQSREAAAGPDRRLVLDIGFDRLLGILLRVFVAGYTANRYVGQRSLEVILSER